MAPIFQKYLSRTDVTHRLSIPSVAFLKHFPPIIHGNRVNIRVRYGYGNEESWKLPCYVRRPPCPYDKPVISGGWRSFGADKGFAVGDLLIFYKERDQQGCVYRFVVLRKDVGETGQLRLV